MNFQYPHQNVIPQYLRTTTPTKLPTNNLRYTNYITPIRNQYPTYSPLQKQSYSHIQSAQTTTHPTARNTIQLLDNQNYNQLQIKQQSFQNQRKQQSILLQLLKPPKPTLPQSIHQFLEKPAILELQDLISRQIHNYILLNDNKYTGEKPTNHDIDVRTYKLTMEQYQDSNLRSSVMILLNQQLQFILNLIKEMGDMFEKNQHVTPKKSHNYFHSLPGSPKSSPKTSANISPQKKIDMDISQLQKLIDDKEQEKMNLYIKQKGRQQSFYDEDNKFIMNYKVLEDSLMDWANEFIIKIYDVASHKAQIIMDWKTLQMDVEEQPIKHFQLDHWVDQSEYET